MVILHAFFALASGFATIALLSLAFTALLTKLTPSWAEDQGSPESSVGNLRRMEPGAVFVHLGSSLLAAACGGYLTAFVAGNNPLVHVLALGIAVLALGALNALQSRGKYPIWYQLAQLAILPLGVLVGGLLRLRVLGIL